MGIFTIISQKEIDDAIDQACLYHAFRCPEHLQVLKIEWGENVMYVRGTMTNETTKEL